MNTVLQERNNTKGLRKLIVVLSVAIPLVVAVLFGIKIEGFDLGFLPSVYAVINGLTAVVLIAALLAIKQKNVPVHRALVRLALLLSVLFLALYVAYHMTSDSTVYGDTNHSGDLDILERTAIGGIAYVYYFLLITHILLSIAVIPLVLFTYLFAWEGNFEKHKKYTRFAFPLWLYVAITGVLVYLFISPYYQ